MKSIFTKIFTTDHVQEQEMEIEALEAILMDEIQGLHHKEYSTWILVFVEFWYWTYKFKLVTHFFVLMYLPETTEWKQIEHFKTMFPNYFVSTCTHFHYII